MQFPWGGGEGGGRPSHRKELIKNSGANAAFSPPGWHKAHKSEPLGGW